MIPLSAGDKMYYVDEKSGVKFILQPVTGETEDNFLAIMEEFKTAGKSNREQLPVLNKLFNFFVVGWEGKDIKPFPDNGNPARFFNYKFKDALTSKAIEMCGLGVDEVKN